MVIHGNRKSENVDATRIYAYLERRRYVRSLRIKYNSVCCVSH
jgi:hypothetical protein